MRIAIVTHYFPPEIGAPQARLSDLARFWTESGHEVHVITGMPNHPTGVVPFDYRGRCNIEETIDGYRVSRCWLYATPNEGFLRKTLGHLSFMLSGLLIGSRRLKKPDVVVVSSPTFFSIGSAWLLARLKGAKFVVEVRDLWPAIFVDLGVLTNKRIIRLLEYLELAAYRAADEVVVVTEGFRDHITTRGIPATKVHTIRNGVDLAKFSPAHQAPPGTRERLGAKNGELLVLYIGAHGISQGLTSVIEAAALMSSRPVHFALVGEGADKATVRARVSDLSPGNVTMLPGVPRHEVADLLAAADVCLVPLRDIPLFTTFIPSKMFELMAAGRPIVASVAGEAKSILDDAGAVVVPPEDGAALAEVLDELIGDPHRRSKMAQRGYEYVSKEFDRKRLAGQYEKILQRSGAPK